MIIKGVNAKSILDSRKEKTILVFIKTNVGEFSASSPNGKSTGKHEKKSYKKNLEEDIKTLKKFSDYFSEEVIERFEDLRRIEDIVEGHIGANSLFALESAVLKAIAKEQKKEVWEIINSSHDFSAKAKKHRFPRLVGNCVGGGAHSETAPPGVPLGGTRISSRPQIAEYRGKKPDFQEFLLIPDSKSVKKSFEINKKAKKQAEEILRRNDKNFEGKKNDENAWMTSLNERQVLDVLTELKLPLGLDVAASGFCKRKKYNYKNPLLKRTEEEQLGYLINLIKNFDLFYIEDGFSEEDFESFGKLLRHLAYPKVRNTGAKKFPDSLIVGDDLTVTNYKRLEKAIKMKSINAIIVKPNQIGSLLEVKKVCELAKKNNIKIVFSHRSGETEETILADLAFGFNADFFKCGIEGDVREGKIKRLIEIEENL